MLYQDRQVVRLAKKVVGINGQPQFSPSEMQGMNSMKDKVRSSKCRALHPRQFEAMVQYVATPECLICVTSSFISEDTTHHAIAQLHVSS